MRDISNRDDIINGNDIIARIDELEFSNDKEDIDELKILRALVGDCEDSDDWPDSTLIRDTHFTEYAKEYVDEIGDIPSSLPSYIENNIDWDGVADDLKQDFNSVEYGDVTYLVR